MNRAFCGMVLVVAAFAIVGLQSPVQADVIAQHSGVANPTTEGFGLSHTTYFQTLADPDWNGVNNTSSNGEDAWWTHDGNGYGAQGFYYRNLTGTDLSNISTNGWRAQMRVLDNDASDDGTDVGIGLNMYTATKDFEIYVGTDASNNPLVYQWLAPGNVTLIATTTLGFGYHTYSMVAGPGDPATANVLVDGNTVATITGVAFSGTPQFSFGSYSPTAHFNADYSQVSLSTVVPEPSALVLLAVGFVSLLAYAWRKRR